MDLPSCPTVAWKEILFGMRRSYRAAYARPHLRSDLRLYHLWDPGSKVGPNYPHFLVFIHLHDSEIAHVPSWIGGCDSVWLPRLVIVTITTYTLALLKRSLCGKLVAMSWWCSSHTVEGLAWMEAETCLSTAPHHALLHLMVLSAYAGSCVPFSISGGVDKMHWWVDPGSVTYTCHNADVTVNCQKEEWCKSAYFLLSLFTTHLAWFMFWSILQMALKWFGPDKWCRNHKMRRFSQKEQ